MDCPKGPARTWSIPAELSDSRPSSRCDSLWPTCKRLGSASQQPRGLRKSFWMHSVINTEYQRPPPSPACFVVEALRRCMIMARGRIMITGKRCFTLAPSCILCTKDCRTKKKKEKFIDRIYLPSLGSTGGIIQDWKIRLRSREFGSLLKPIIHYLNNGQQSGGVKNWSNENTIWFYTVQFVFYLQFCFEGPNRSAWMLSRYCAFSPSLNVDPSDGLNFGLEWVWKCEVKSFFLHHNIWIVPSSCGTYRFWRNCWLSYSFLCGNFLCSLFFRNIIGVVLVEDGYAIFFSWFAPASETAYWYICITL